jgi:hypothetical protein
MDRILIMIMTITMPLVIEDTMTVFHYTCGFMLDALQVVLFWK